MRRLLAIAFAGLLCLTIVGPVAAKGPPTITRLDTTVISADDFAGTCDFPVELVDSYANSLMLEYPADADGNQLVRFAGGFRSTLTNLDTGKAIDIKYFGNAKYLFQADGSIDIVTGGTVLAWFYEEDVLSGIDPGIYLMTGPTHLLVDAATFLALEPVEAKGRVVDLCAALS